MCAPWHIHVQLSDYYNDHLLAIVLALLVLVLAHVCLTTTQAITRHSDGLGAAVDGLQNL